MMSGSRHKLIDYHRYLQNKRPAYYRKAHDAVRLPPQQQRNLSHCVRLHKADAGNDFDKRLQTFENYARHQFTRVYQAFSLRRLPESLNQMLEQDILPTLQDIGFESAISKTLFEIAPSAWKLMVPANKHIVPFQPMIEREIQEVRQGIKLELSKRGDAFPRFAWESQVHTLGNIKETISPEHLLNILDEIATPWIILPRAYRFLEKQQSCYLPLYAKTIKLETREICLKLFSRITVEFMGNFAFKFADRRHPYRRLSKLLFYGYAVLFWKTLRCPPRNMENSLSFNHYLNWLFRLSDYSGLLSDKECAFLDQMVYMRNRVFAPQHSERSPRNGHPDSSRFIVTFRHGRSGMATILKYFGIDQFLKTRQTAHRFASARLQNELHCLLDRIRVRYASESKHTRKNLNQFMGWIGVAYDIAQPGLHQTQRHFLNRILKNIRKSANTKR
jgi:hypothetical protein